MDDSTFSNGEAVLGGGGNPTALLFSQSTGGSGRDPRRDSGVTLLSLLQDLGELLTDDLNSKPTQTELEVVGSRVASLLPSLIEEFCQKKENASNISVNSNTHANAAANSAKSEMEIQSICKLMKLAIKQFPSIFGRDNQVRRKRSNLLVITSHL